MNPNRPYVKIAGVDDDYALSTSGNAQDVFSEDRVRAEVGELLTTMKNTILIKYLSTLLVHPLEISKTICQVQRYNLKKKKKQDLKARDTDGVEDEDEDEEEQYEENDTETNDMEEHDFDDMRSYFETNVTSLDVAQQASRSVITDSTGYAVENKSRSVESWQISPKPFSIKSILSCLWSKEGIRGLWKGHLTSFLHSLLSMSIEGWISGTISGLFSLPNPLIIPPADSIRPFTSLAIRLCSSVTTALLLAPLDIARTLLILMPLSARRLVGTTKEGAPVVTKIGLIQCLRRLPSFCPGSLILPTALHSSLPLFMSQILPVSLRNYVSLSSLTMNLVTSASSVLQFAVQLPLETVLRRAQANVIYSLPPQRIVPLAKYTGITGTIWSLLCEEDGGKLGIEGLYRGWRVGFWGATSVWTLGLLTAPVTQPVAVEF